MPEPTIDPRTESLKRGTQRVVDQRRQQSVSDQLTSMQSQIDRLADMIEKILAGSGTPEPTKKK